MARNFLRYSLLVTGLTLAAHPGSAAETVGVRVEEWNKIDIAGLGGKLGGMLTGGKDGQTRTIVINEAATRQAVATRNTIVITDLDLGGVFTVKNGSCTDVVSFDQLREQWEKLTEDGNPFEAIRSGRPTNDSGEAPKMKADITTNVIGPKEVAGIAGTEMQIEIVVHEEGMTIEESGGVIVESLTVHGKSESLLKRIEFDRNYAETLGDALQIREQLKELKNAFMSNPAIEQGMAEFKKANLTEDSAVLSTDTKVRMVPDPRVPEPTGETGGGESTGSPTENAFKSIGKMFRRKKNKNKEEQPTPEIETTAPGQPKQMLAVQQQIRTVDQGGADLLALPDNCLKKLKKISG